MAYVHTSVNTTSKAYLQIERRYNYTTPKSFLEQIALYMKLLNRKHDELSSKIKRLENGLEKLNSTALQVAELKKTLAIQEIELKEKNDAADALIEIVRIETEKVQASLSLSLSRHKNLCSWWKHYFTRLSCSSCWKEKCFLVIVLKIMR